jgi:hypothetical protein
MRLSLLSDIAAMMIPKAYLLIVARPPRRAATVTPSRQRKKHPAAKLLTKDEARRDRYQRGEVDAMAATATSH